MFSHVPIVELNRFEAIYTIDMLLKILVVLNVPYQINIYLGYQR